MRLLLLGIILWLFALVAFSTTIVNTASQPVNMRVVGAMAAATPTGTPPAASPTPTATASAFDPNTIAGLKCWWKADAITSPGLIIRRPGQQPIEGVQPKDVEPRAINDGDPVNIWPDSSSVAFNLIGNNSIYKSSILNAKPVVRFNGTSSWFQRGGGIVINPGEKYTMFAVVKTVSTSALGHTIINGAASGPSNVILRRDGADFSAYINSGAWISAVETGGVVVGAWNVLTSDWDGTNIHLWRSGVLKATAGATSITPNLVDTIFIGADNTPGQFWDGDMAEILIYNSALSATDRQNVENYLKAKYALP